MEQNLLLNILHSPDGKAATSIIVDVNGTLLDDDKPITSMIKLIQCLYNYYNIFIVTAHNLEGNLYVAEQKRLRDANIPHDELFGNIANIKAEDYIIKKAIYEKYIKGNTNIDFVIDNNKDCIKMYRELGIPTLRFKLDK